MSLIMKTKLCHWDKYFIKSSGCHTFKIFCLHNILHCISSFWSWSKIYQPLNSIVMKTDVSFIVMQLWTLMKQRRKFLLRSQNQMLFWWVINIGNRTDSSPIQPVIIRVIDKIGRPWSTSPICQLWVWLQN